MSNSYLLPVYKEIYHETFSYDSCDKRMKMQKAIYLLQEMGAPVGDYAFFWYKHGPYSQDLQDAMYAATCSGMSTLHVTFSADMNSAVQKIAELLNKKVSYSSSHWAECLASLHYLQTNIFSASASPEEIVGELQKRKPHLSNKTLNLEALRLVSELCA